MQDISASISDERERWERSMRKGLLLTRRDFDIFCFLVYGMATDHDIYRNFFFYDGGNEKTRRRVMVKRLRKLEAEGYIISKVNARINGVIYMLQKKGAQLAADELGRKVSNVWTHGSKYSDMYHDLMTSELARMALWEIEKAEGFENVFYINEHCLKTGKAAQKGLCYPDFLLGIKTTDGEEKYAVEIDCGTVSQADFIAKMKSFGDTILVVTNTENRMNLLRGYCLRMYRSKAIYMNTYENIKKREGFFKAKWFSIAANQWQVLLGGL